MINTNLRLSGLATGMDTETMIRDLMKAQRIPLDKKIKEKQIWQWKQEDFRSINTNLLTLKNKAFDMRLESPYYTKKVNTGNKDIVTAAAISSASSGTYNLKVSQLAASAINKSTGSVSAQEDNKISTEASLLSQAGKFAVTGSFFEGKTSADTFTVSIQYAEGQSKTLTFSYGDSLDSIINTINLDKDAGISLFYDSGTDKLVATSKTTGADARLQISGDLFNTVLQINNDNKVAGQDAVFELNGHQTSRSSNSFSINGITFNLKGLTPGGLSGEATTITVETDTDAIFNNIKSFIDSYNELYETISQKLTEERFRDYQPLTDDEKTSLKDYEIEKWEQKARSGLLRSDPLLSGALNDIRRIMTTQLHNSGSYRSLAEIGIKTSNYWDNEKGKLKIDETKLRQAIEKDSRGIYELFAGDSSVTEGKGIVRQLYDSVDSAIKKISSQAGSSASLVDNSYIGRTINSINKRIDSMESRLEKAEQRYWRQFSAMEKAIQSMNQQSSWLTAQLNANQNQQ